MTTLALNNLWNYLQGLSLTKSDREWLAGKLVMPVNSADTAEAEERKAQFLKLAGSWSDTPEGEEHYNMMIHRNDNRPTNRSFPKLD